MKNKKWYGLAEQDSARLSMRIVMPLTWISDRFTSFITVALTLTAGSLVACSSYVRTPDIPHSLALARDPIDDYADVLRDHVDEDGWIDFIGLKRFPEKLGRYINFVANTNPLEHPQLFPSPSHILAHYLNSYNALAIYNVLESNIPTRNSGFQRVQFFYFKKLKIAGHNQSLYEYENNVIRKLNEPRVHFALNCMAAGCPRLPRRPFTGQNLEQELIAAAQLFFSEPRNLQIKEQKKEVYVSEILHLYSGDFSNQATNLIVYINRYVSKPIPESFKIKYLPYDWTIIEQSRKPTPPSQ